VKMHRNLSSHLQGEDKKEFEARVVENKIILDRLLDLIAKKDNDAQKRKLKPDYSIPAWAEHQADTIGYQRALEEMKDLLTIE